MNNDFATPAIQKDRLQAGCNPVRVRATITIDIDAEDYLAAEKAKAAIAAEYDGLRRACANATLEFRQRKPRTGRRSLGPTLIMAPYVDD